MLSRTTCNFPLSKHHPACQLDAAYSARQMLGYPHDLMSVDRANTMTLCQLHGRALQARLGRHLGVRGLAECKRRPCMAGSPSTHHRMTPAIQACRPRHCTNARMRPLWRRHSEHHRQDSDCESTCAQGAHLAAPAAASRARAACAGSQAAAAGRRAPCRAAQSPPAPARPRGRPAALLGSLSSAAPGSLGLQPRSSSAKKCASGTCDNVSQGHSCDCKGQPSETGWPRTWHLDAWDGGIQPHRDYVAHSAGFGLQFKTHMCEH